jgi:hypothetical protein
MPATVTAPDYRDTMEYAFSDATSLSALFIESLSRESPFAIPTLNTTTDHLNVRFRHAILQLLDSSPKANTRNIGFGFIEMNL